MFLLQAGEPLTAFTGGRRRGSTWPKTPPENRIQTFFSQPACKGPLENGAKPSSVHPEQGENSAFVPWQLCFEGEKQSRAVPHHSPSAILVP